ncbi:MAG: type II toxin-antitoxin system YoeB family toxin [Dermatophilaceae bacterium]
MDPGTTRPRTLRLSRTLAGPWSRRIAEEHRLVSLVDGDNPGVPP